MAALNDDATLDELREAMYREVEQSDEEARYWGNQVREAAETDLKLSEVMRERIDHERRSYVDRRTKPEQPPEPGAV